MSALSALSTLQTFAAMHGVVEVPEPTREPTPEPTHASRQAAVAAVAAVSPPRRTSKPGDPGWRRSKTKARRARCDVCANERFDVREVQPGELRASAAPWIHHLCPSCLRRLGAPTSSGPDY